MGLGRGEIDGCLDFMSFPRSASSSGSDRNYCVILENLETIVTWDLSTKLVTSPVLCNSCEAQMVQGSSLLIWVKCSVNSSCWSPFQTISKMIIALITHCFLFERQLCPATQVLNSWWTFVLWRNKLSKYQIDPALIPQLPEALFGSL